MFDKEIEAIAKCTELVKELDDDAKIRVLKYLIERFGIGSYPTIPPTQVPPTINRPILTKNTLSTTSLNGNMEQIEVFQEAESVNYPSLKDLLVKNYPKTEGEWVLCYAFYSSHFGKDTFKKDDIVEKYRENGRHSSIRIGNLTNNINVGVKKDWIKSVNNNEYFLKPEGIEYAKEVLNGRSTSKESKPTIKRKTNSTQKVEE